MKEETRRFLNQINTIFLYVSTSIEKEGAPPFIVSEKYFRIGRKGLAI